MTEPRASKLAQQRSRETLEQILHGAAEELLDHGSADELTTTAVADRLDVPVGTIYRYFADRWEIVAALIDREVEEVDAELKTEIEKTPTVSIEGLMRIVMETLDRRLEARPLTKILWFGSRGNDIVLAKITERYRRAGEWMTETAEAAGMAKDFPAWGPNAIVWMCDRTFELMYRGDRPREDQLAILDLAIKTWSGELNEYATPAGLKGIPTAKYLAVAMPESD